MAMRGGAPRSRRGERGEDEAVVAAGKEQRTGAKRPHPGAGGLDAAPPKRSKAADSEDGEAAEAREPLRKPSRPSGKVLSLSKQERQAKLRAKNRELRKLRAAEQRASAALRETRKGEVAAYLAAWRDDRDSWKFNKSLQVWLLRYVFDRKLLPKSLFQDFALAYLASLQGGARERMRAEATEAVETVECDGKSLADRVAELEAEPKEAEAEVEAETPHVRGATPAQETPLSAAQKVKALRSRYKRAKAILLALA
jgi:hypothetical protein